MKKILGVIFLSLLLSGCGSTPSSQVQQEFIDRGMIKIGMNMAEVHSIVKGMDTFAEVPNRNTNPKYLFLTTTFNGAYKKNSKIYLGEATNSNPKSNATPWGNMIGWKLKNYRLIKIYDDSISAYDRMISLEKDPKAIPRYVGLKKNYIQYSTQSANNTQSTTASTSSINTADKITQAKQICTDLGYQPKTEKHADCSMQMMSIQFETTNKVASASGGTTQEIIVTHRNDYDIWDALVDYSRAIDPKNKSTTSSSSNRGTNCVIGRTNPTFGTTTMNCN